MLKWLMLVAMAAICLTADLLTKRMAEQNLAMGDTREVLPFLFLQRTANDGVAFGLMGGRTAVIVLANLVALAVVLVYVFLERRALLAGLAGGAVIGGSLGNLVQRLAGDGHVTDFLKFPHWPNFNLADVFIDAGIAAVCIGLVVEAVRAHRAGRRPVAPEEPDL